MSTPADPVIPPVEPVIAPPEPVIPPVGAPPAAQRRIGLWGATQSGKSTFLSALFIAAARSHEEMRVWGVNDESTDFLVRNTHILNAQHQFPPPTQHQQPLSWALHMNVPNRARGWRRRLAPPTMPFDFRIDLQDAPGRAFAAVAEAESGRLVLGDGGDETTEVASYLASCRGLLLLIDPIREREHGDAHQYFHGTLLRIAQRVEVAPGEHLPHFVAVCITKFDDPEVFRFARDNEYLSYSEYDPMMFPRVHDDEAERFMQELFTGSQVSDVDLVTGALRQYFRPERVQYFVTSAVGFHLDRSGEFREDDYQNVVPVADGQFEIRGQIHPINVAEPLLWLGERIAETEE
jgi:hypothetical protein